jgi:hypothetical protein
MSMRVMVYSGWIMVLVGAVMVVGGVIGCLAGGPAAAGLLLGLGGGGLGCAAGGWFMVWLGRGWDTPLDSAADLYKYGRPANAEVLSVEGAQLDAAGTRTAKLSVRVSPVNESAYKTTRAVALPGGRIPNVGETVTVKFDPNSRKDFVLLERSFEVKDHVTQTADAYFGGLKS